MPVEFERLRQIEFTVQTGNYEVMSFTHFILRLLCLYLRKLFSQALARPV